MTDPTETNLPQDISTEDVAARTTVDRRTFEFHQFLESRPALASALNEFNTHRFIINPESRRVFTEGDGLVEVTLIDLKSPANIELSFLFTHVNEDMRKIDGRKFTTADFLLPGARAQHSALSTTNLPIVSIANLGGTPIVINKPQGDSLTLSLNFFQKPELLHQVVVSNSFIAPALAFFHMFFGRMKISGDTTTAGAVKKLVAQLNG